MRAIILAAGIGQRLQHWAPKCLLEFGRETLLERHLRTIAALGIEQVHLCVGFEAATIEAHLSELAPPVAIHTVFNPDYREGSVVSLWCMREVLRSGSDIVLMDADVLYTPTILQRLVTARAPNVFLLDRDFETGDEPVKLCLDGQRVVAFTKTPPGGLEYTVSGESVGFFRFAPAAATRLAAIAEDYVTSNRRDAPHEDAVQELALSRPEDFGHEDITGMPWIEIDFPEDVRRAREHILPEIHGR